MQRNDIKPSEITPEAVFLDRRRIVTAAVAMGLLPGSYHLAGAAEIPASGEFSGVSGWPRSTTEKLTPSEVFSSYCNFYEFGTNKSDPARYADSLITDAWSVEITGEANRLGTYTLEDILRPHSLEERIYRHRCVERWSIVVPWVGFPLADLLSRFEPNSNARFVQFFTLVDADQMRGVSRAVLDWPYREGLRIDEATHPLTFVSVGAYGKVLPNQNGAPLRLVVPWKYGFKSIKSIVRIHFTSEKPRLGTESQREGGWTWTTSWNDSYAQAYGFYSNVNPNREHPGWTQEVERRLDGSLFSPNIATELFNGYGEEVAGMYRGMDLIANY